MNVKELRKLLKGLPDEMEVDVYRPAPMMNARVGTFHSVMSAGVFSDAEPPMIFLITPYEQAL